MHPQKIIVIGSPASGKTTLARTLGECLGYPVHHLDKHFWKPQWTPVAQEEFVKIQTELMREPQWVIEGNFTRSIAHRAAQADTIILFELPKRVIWWRWFKRYIRDFNKSRPDMGGGNKSLLPRRESLQYIHNFPLAQVHAALEPFRASKNIVIIRDNQDLNAFLKTLSGTVKSS